MSERYRATDETEWATLAPFPWRVRDGRAAILAKRRPSIEAETRAAALDEARVERLREAAQALVDGWIDDESGMQTFDPDLVDALAAALSDTAEGADKP